MIKNLLNRQSSTITSAAVIIGAAALVSNILGMIRDRILAGEFGASASLDIYYAAFRVPDFIYNILILGALSAGFIPVFIAFKKRGEDEWQLASGVLNVIVAALLFFGVIFFVLAPYIVPLIAPGFKADEQNTAVTMTRIMFLSPLFLGISAVWGGILQSLKKFFVYSLAPIFYNIGIMIGALIFTRWWGVYGLAWGVVLGAASHMLVQLIAVFSSGFKYNFILNLRHPGVREIMKLMVPRTLGLAIMQVNLLVINIIASTLVAGSIAVFNFANNLQSFPLTMFGTAFAIAVFPALSSAAANDDKKSFIESFSLVARQILFFIIPFSVLILVLRAQIVRVVYGAGQFNWNDTILTADALALFCLSMFAQNLIQILARGFYALRNTLTPFLIGLAAVALNVFLALYLTSHSYTFFTLKISGVVGLVLAFSLSSIVQMILLWVFLRIKMGGLDERRILFAAVKISIATVLMGLGIQTLKYFLEPYTGTTTFLGIFAQGAIAGIGGILIFVIASLLLRSEEMILFISSLKRKFLHKEVVPELEDKL